MTKLNISRDWGWHICIFAVFTIVSTGDAINFTVANNIDFENSLIENIFTNFNNILKQDDKIIDIITNSNSNIVLKIKWKVTEYEKIRILQLLKK